MISIDPKIYAADFCVDPAGKPNRFKRLMRDSKILLTVEHQETKTRFHVV